MRFTSQTGHVIGRVGGAINRSRRTPAEITAPARLAFNAQLEAKAAIDPGLPPDEYQARLAAYRRAHYIRLALKSAAVRRASADARQATTTAQKAPTSPVTTTGVPS